MTTAQHQTYIYVGLAGEGEHLNVGGLYRCKDGDDGWESITKGLPAQPQVRALLLHPDNPAIIYAGTQQGPYRSDDRGEHWEALEAPGDGLEVWSLAVHPQNPNVLYAGYEPCAIYRSEDGGVHWQKTHTEHVVFPHISTYMPPLAKRVIGISADPSNPGDMYAAIEVGGLLASRDGGDTWESITDGLYVRNNTIDLHAVQVSPAAPGMVFIATQIAMFRSRNRGHRWEHVHVDEMFPGGSYCRDLQVAPDQPRTIYLAAGAGGGGAPRGTQEAGALFRSPDLGDTWERLALGETPASRMMQVAIDPAAPSHIYGCTYAGQVYSSHNSGQTWRQNQIPVAMSRSLHVYPMVCG